MQDFLKKFRRLQLQPENRKSKSELTKVLPESPGVYVFFHEEVPIYIGKAINLKRRVGSYFDLHLEQKTARMVSLADSVSFIRVTSELESLLLEAKLIKKYLPQYNIAAKDDKHPLYIRITKEKFPRIITARKISENEKNVAFYGPFPSSGNVRSVLKMIRRVFPYSDHKLGKRACLYSHIGLCNPCPSEIEAIKDKSQSEKLRKIYLKNIGSIKKILDGKFDSLRKDLEKEMHSASVNQHFEEAAGTRDRLKRLEYITSPQMPVEYFMENPNLYQDLRRKELTELKRILSPYLFVQKQIERIECFDVAHLAGVNPTASMVTFIGGEPEKKYYRHFKVRQSKGNSDVDSMREIIKRRKNHLKDWGSPDLIIVDGGKPQVGVFIKELSDIKIPVIGLAKRFETLVIPTKEMGASILKEYRLPRGAALNLVQRVRDEAHRFARRYHHKLLSNELIHENNFKALHH